MSAIRLKAITGTDTLQITNPLVALSQIQPLTSDGVMNINSLKVYGPTHATNANQVDVGGLLTLNGQPLYSSGTFSMPGNGGSQAVSNMVFTGTSFRAMINVVYRVGSSAYQRAMYELQVIKPGGQYALTAEATGATLDITFSVDPASGQVYVNPGPNAAYGSITLTWRAETLAF